MTSQLLTRSRRMLQIKLRRNGRKPWLENKGMTVPSPYEARILAAGPTTPVAYESSATKPRSCTPFGGIGPNARTATADVLGR